MASLDPFGPVHLAIVAAAVGAGGALAALARRRPEASRPLRLALAAILAVNELAWYGYAVAQGWFRPPHGLPLDLCDLTLWVAVYALVRPAPWALEIAWYLGLGGQGMALLQPDLGAPFPSYPAVKFFLAHGGVVAALLFLAGSGRLRPRPGSWWRVFLWGNAYAALVGVMNAAFGTNYMYLREKPEAGSLLDYLGPWPWYVLGGEAVALALLALLYLPFRVGRGGSREGRLPMARNAPTTPKR